MRQDELPSIETKEWQGINFTVESPFPRYKILKAIETNGDSSYQQAIGRIDDLNRFAISKIESTKLAQLTIKPPIYTVAVIPASRFLQATGIPESFKDWATVCSRTIWKPDKKEDAVVVSSAHAKKINFQPTNLDLLTEDQLDIVREAIHEHLPTVKDRYFPYAQATALPLSEAMDEAVPYYVLDLGKKMPRFTTFRTQLKEIEILTVSDLWEGFSRYSSNPVANNRAYASALLLGVGLIHRLQDKEGLSKTEALSAWIDAMSKVEDGKSAVAKLADRIGVTEQLLWNEKKIQSDGQEILRVEFAQVVQD